MKNTRIEFLDTLRGISIVMVLLYHYFYIYYRNKEVSYEYFDLFTYFISNFNLVIAGVFIFFLISGFVISLTLQENREKKYYFDFMVKRFFRIIPTYWFAIFFSVVLFWIFNFSYKSFSIEQILANMFMLQGFFHINHVDGVFWTILIEVKFYIIVFVLGIFGLWKYKNYITLLFAIFCFTVLFYGVLNDKFLANAIWFYLWSMFIGSLFTQESSKLKIFNFSLFVIFLVISLYLVRFEELYKTGIVESWIIGGVIFTLFYNKKWSIRLLSSFGKISYSYYLLHQNTGYLILSLGIFSSFMMNHIFNILITIFISFIVYRYIETPSNQYGKQLIKRKK